MADCRYLTRDENNSEDLAQEVFVKAFFGLRSFEGRSSFRHWLQRIKVHHCLNYLKRRGRKEGVSIDEDIGVKIRTFVIENVPSLDYDPPLAYARGSVGSMG